MKPSQGTLTCEELFKSIVPTTDVREFFVQYLFILENEVRQFQFEFSEISTIEE